MDLDIIVIVYLLIQLSLGFLVSIFGAIYVKREVPQLAFSSSWLKLYLKTVWQMRSVYGSFFVHLFDMFTDLLIIVEWLQLEANGKDTVPNIDARTMAYNAIGVLLLHKIVSVFVFWTKERNIHRCILQFFDLLVFQEIYLTHNKILNSFKNNQFETTQTQTVANQVSNTSTNPQQTRNTNASATNKSETETLTIQTVTVVNNNDQISVIDATNSIGALEWTAKDIDTTTSFKLVRSLEAVFESIPQSILQLVFLMRIGFDYGTNGSITLIIITIASIFQSIVSMTNAVLNTDNAQMTIPKWKRYTQTFPPTKEFLKDFLCRLCEILYRIGLLSLIWTVCEGMTFAIVISIELFIIVFLSVLYIYIGEDDWKIDNFFLRLETIIILPSELFYEVDDNAQHLSVYLRTEYVGGMDFFESIFLIMHFCCLCCCCCYHFAATITTRGKCCNPDERQYFIPDIRIGLSFWEWLIIILYAIFGDNGQRLKFLIGFEHGLIVFILSIISCFIYTQYLYLFPNFQLPNQVSIRSKYGLAFNGELNDLKHIKIPQFPKVVEKRYRNWIYIAGERNELYVSV